MKKWTFRILIFLILGVVTTVGVAWGLAVCREWRTARDHFEENDEQYIAMYILQSGERDDASRAAHCAWGRGWSTAFVAHYPLPADEIASYYDHAGVALTFDAPPPHHDLSWHDADYSSYVFGWPRPALGAAVLWPENDLGSFREEFMVVAESDPLPRWQVGQNVPDFPTRFLPLRPIFPGFIINTLFYAAMWFGIFFGVAALRRFVRKKRGRCVKCSYDLRGQFDKGCPECGWGREDKRATSDE